MTVTTMDHIRSTAALAATCLVLAAATPTWAQGDDEDLPPNHPSTDPYTQGDAVLLAAAGLTSLGGFEFGTTDTADVDKYMAEADIRWIETEHFQIGMALGPYKPGRTDKKKIQAELAELQLVLPEVPLKPRSLDPWLRAHLFARRAEAIYTRMQQILQVDDSMFPPPVEMFDINSKFMGMGPYLGQRNKYEVLMVPSEGMGNDFLSHYFGLQVYQSQRWNVLERDSLVAVLVVDDGDLKDDTGMHCHMAFNLAINLLDGYKHYSYELPIWIREGIGHLLEREVSPVFNTFDGDEGSAGVQTTKSDWLGETRKLIKKDELPSMAKMVRLRGYGELDLPLHFACWSKAQYLAEVHPDALAKILGDLTGLLSEDHIPDGSNMLDHHREAFQTHLGMTYAQFDSAWLEWVESPAAELAQTPPPERDEGIGQPLR
ncbi:hypothetical protein [Engelhardtia mirabilis]|uniref:DUF1570 domain-containing protein n=1 Tax=Engelhardtia mirabilis TaxID=2528011 RepID=A0A518BH33_9BACT|nr:hypothetical protein Pla133_13580 [Planctomycetes bacterium Pla133]QDV00617.1 hypothetical protein Pla86_13570 [Planctomycetes bacterium Pla86]